MSAATPTASTPDASTPAPAPTEAGQATLAADRLVLDYLRARGHKSAEQALTDTLGSLNISKGESSPGVCVIAVDLVFHPHILQAKPRQNPKLKKLSSLFQNRDFGFLVQAYSK